eukprot:g27492.t1
MERAIPVLTQRDLAVFLTVEERHRPSTALSEWKELRMRPGLVPVTARVVLNGRGRSLMLRRWRRSRRHFLRCQYGGRAGCV